MRYLLKIRSIKKQKNSYEVITLLLTIFANTAMADEKVKNKYGQIRETEIMGKILIIDLFRDAANINA